MRSFRFGGVVRKYFVPYVLVRAGGGDYDEDGVWRDVPAERVPLRGSVQPLSARLKAAEGGNYTESDRMLYTLSTHSTVDVIEHQGIQYRVAEETEREYSDINQYLLRKVVANAPV
ncbi:hypothetical protein [Paenibacillus sp. FSL H8-0259]|uniref:hypothetical protein n=1 Tax=Paenibacillus sp. FSL H8-0259 TaxID=1920423 RepID=UPI00096CADD9|nr:hypothetical protein [Paenibacillus sp. FSL H8-0259]OMF28307.1 hypothetical protein BK132_14715 [Paenibacillus sp. FSL H8-0259]